MWRAICALLFLCAGISLVATTIQFGTGRQFGGVLGLPNGFHGTSTIPQEQVSEVFSKAKKRVSELNQYGNLWRWGAFGCGWTAFLLATVLGAVAAFYGRLQEEGRTLQEQLDFIRRRNRRHSTVIGVCAAVMAIASSIGNRCESQAVASYQRADDVASASRTLRTTLDSNSLSEEQIRATIEELEMELQR